MGSPCQKEDMLTESAALFVHDSGEVHAARAREDFVGQFQGIVLEGDGVAVAVSPGSPGEAIARGEGQRGILAEIPQSAVGVFHHGNQFALGHSHDLDTLGGVHAVEHHEKVGLHIGAPVLLVDLVITGHRPGVALEGVTLELGGVRHRDGGHLALGDGHGGHIFPVGKINLHDTAHVGEAVVSDAGESLRTSHKGIYFCV